MIIIIKIASEEEEVEKEMRTTVETEKCEEAE